MSTKKFVNNLCINTYRKLRSKNIISGKKKVQWKKGKKRHAAGRESTGTHTRTVTGVTTRDCYFRIGAEHQCTGRCRLAWLKRRKEMEREPGMCGRKSSARMPAKLARRVGFRVYTVVTLARVRTITEECLDLMHLHKSTWSLILHI